MTACTNHGGKARRVVTAALVGVLSVGTVPMVALAASTAGDDISLQSVQPAQTLVTADNGQGDEVAIEAGKTVKLEAGTAQYLRPTGIADSEGNDLDLSDYQIYYLDSDGNRLQGGNGDVTDKDASIWFWQPGYGRTDAGKSYYLEITKGSQDILKVKFTYVTEALEGVYAYEEGANPSDTSDTTFVYNGNVLDIKFANADGTTLATSSVVYYNEDSSVAGNTVTNAGSYTARVTAADGRVINVPVTVEALDLTSATVFMEDTTVDTDVDGRNKVLNKLEIGGYAKADHTADFKVTSVKAPNGGAGLASGKGQYSVTIAASDTAAKAGNVTGGTTVTYYVLNNDIADADFFYGATSFPTGVRLSLPDGDSFDPSRIKAVYNDANYRGDQLEVTYTDVISGKTVDASALGKPGSYKVKVRVKAFLDGDDKWVGGSAELTVRVLGTSINADKGLTFTYDGKVVADNGAAAGLVAAYTGEDILPLIGTEVVDSDGNAYEAGADYTVEVTNSKGQVVDSIVAVDTYKVTVKPVTFEANSSNPGNWVLTVKVDEANFGDLKDLKGKYAGAIAYTGSELSVPGASYQELTDNDVTKPVFDKDGNAVYAELSSDLYKVTKIEYSKNGTTGWSTVKSVKDEGFYRATVKLTDEAEKNYQLSDKDFVFEVCEYGHFADVASDAWYAVPVDQAWYWEYVNGIAGTDLFAPNAEITRADVACILFNMAGGDNGTIFGPDEEFGFSDLGGYVTGFDDVDGHAYYAKAIAWAHASGVVNGHDGQFRPMDKITREEFASMLANFAQVKGDYVAADGSALAALPDASTVSGWAEANVAWAVEQGIMGNGGYVAGQSNITRAEVAAMAVNYQPTSLNGAHR